MTSRTRALLLAFCVVLTLLALVTPVARSMRRAEWSYNEGWNIAGAMRLSTDAAGNVQLPRTTGASPLQGGCCQTQLYPAAWGWTTVNYPVLSFALMAALHRVTGDYLFTGRAVSLLSLLACAALLAGIAHALGASRRACLLVGLLCVATFAVCAVEYVGIDDPQLLGDALFLAALFVYVRGRAAGKVLPDYGTVALAAGMFVVAGCVKQSPIDMPLAVLADLLLLSRRRAAWFTGCGVVFGCIAGVLNRHVGGPWFVQELLLGRAYSLLKAWLVLLSVLGPMLPPLALALWMAWRLRHDPRRRIAGLLLLTSICVGGYFGGGSGVAGNALFTALFAVVLLLGLWFDASLWAQRLQALPFVWLMVPALVQSVANPARNLRDAASAERQFAAAETLLRQHPGPALCESMLLCLQAGKPYVFDPFNATRLMGQGRLSEAALVTDIDAHRFGTIQLHTAAPGGREPDDLMRERFPPAALAAIDRNYTVALQQENSVIYLPRDGDSHTGAPSRKVRGMPALVSSQWLADRMGSPDIVLLDATLPAVGVVPRVDTRAFYLQQHLPGAVFFDIDALSDHGSSLPHTLPSAESFAASMGALGISADATIVVYEQGNVFSAPRARWMLQAMGATDVSVLDGGLEAWLGDGLPTESGEVQRAPATFSAVLDASAVTTYAELQATLAAHEQVLDARSAGRFTGTAPEPRPGLSSGHMPGAVNMAYTDLADGERMKSAAALQELFAERQVDLYRPITATCGSGVTAAVVLLAAEIAGAEDLSLYDGSWAEYAQRPDAVIVKE